MGRPCKFCGMKIFAERNEAAGGKLIFRDSKDPDHPIHNCSVERLIKRHNFHDSSMPKIKIFLKSTVNREKDRG